MSEPLSLPADDAVKGRPTRAKVTVKIPQPEVTWGVYLVAKNKRGLCLPGPQHGTVPQLRVELDNRVPEAMLYLPSPGREEGLLLRWTAQDKHLESEPITWEYGETYSGPWKLIGPGPLPNTGRFEWCPTSEVPDQVYLRLTVRDRAGNVAVAVTPKPVLIDRTVPIIGHPRMGLEDETEAVPEAAKAAAPSP